MTAREEKECHRNWGEGGGGEKGKEGRDGVKGKRSRASKWDFFMTGSG
jgi:hypothetical protein